MYVTLYVPSNNSYTTSIDVKDPLEDAEKPDAKSSELGSYVSPMLQLWQEASLSRSCASPAASLAPSYSRAVPASRFAGYPSSDTSGRSSAPCRARGVSSVHMSSGAICNRSRATTCLVGRSRLATARIGCTHPFASASRRQCKPSMHSPVPRQQDHTHILWISSTALPHCTL